MMIRPALCALLLTLWPATIMAQTPGTSTGEGSEAAAGQTAAQAPILRLDFPTSEAVPGQPVDLRLTILVPTFMPKPPEWPGFAAPDLLVRVPPTRGGAVSEEIGGATWAGVTRRYTLTPLVAGPVDLPAQEIAITWSDPETGAPRKDVLQVPPVTLTGIVPAAAQGLDPFIAAETLQLTQEITGTPDALNPGDSVTRSVTQTITGASPILLPQVLPDTRIPGLVAYPDSPKVTETDANGIPGGTRTDRVVLMAEGGGAGELPAVTLRWFNLKTGAVETAEVPGLAITISGPPVRSGASRDWRDLLPQMLAVAGSVLLAAVAARWFWPRMRRALAAARADRHASEPFAYRALRRAVAARDHAATLCALDCWAGRLAGADPRQDPAVQAALVGLGAARFRGTAPADPAPAWAALATALSAVRDHARETSTATRLPPLNPSRSAA